MLRDQRPFDRKHFEPIVNHRSHWKPRGGFWTCPVNERGSSDWIEMIQDPDHAGKKTRYYELDFEPSSLYVVSKVKDLDHLYEQYPFTNELYEFLTALDEPKFEPIVEMGRTIDWEKLSEDYDGLWLKWSGLLSIKRSRKYGYNNLFSSWDFESILWFRWPSGMTAEEKPYPSEPVDY